MKFKSHEIKSNCVIVTNISHFAMGSGISQPQVELHNEKLDKSAYNNNNDNDSGIEVVKTQDSEAGDDNDNKSIDNILTDRNSPTKSSVRAGTSHR